MSADVVSPRGLPSRPAAIFGALLLIGAASLLFGIFSSDEETTKRAYRVFLHNWLLWGAISQGALALSAGMRLTNANWQGPIHRIVDSMGAYIPVSFLLFVFVYAGRHHLFEWTHHPIAGKEWWFQPGFTFTRDTLALIWVTFVSTFYLYMSVRPMLGQARDNATGWKKSVYGMWTSGWRGEDVERRVADRRLRKMAAVVALSFALCYSLIAIDMIMSLSPEWVSTMFPAYYAWGGFLGAVSLTTITCLVMRESDTLRGGELTTSRLHDLGKMIFAFSIFWMYLFWSQYFVIWYANIPEETGFIQARLGTQFLQDTWYMEGFMERISEPYVMVTLTAWLLVWILPFWVLLGQRPKKTPAIVGTIAVGSVVGLWIERYILITPSLVKPAAVLEGASTSPFGIMELGIGAGFVGLFFLCFLTFGRVFPGALPVKAEA